MLQGFASGKRFCPWIHCFREDRVLDRPAFRKIGALTPLTPNTVELIPTLGALIPRGGPVQDGVGASETGAQEEQERSQGTLLPISRALLPITESVQGCLAHKKTPPPPRTTMGT